MDATMLSVLSRWSTTRSLVCAVLAIFLVIWGFTDVRKRGRTDPATPMNHMTDLTVYTEAGAAFFDGRDPYSVANPRGWHYLYPPLLAIVLAPLAKLDSQWQVVIWYFFSIAVAWGCCYESMRLLRVLMRALPSKETDATMLGGAPVWLVAFAAAAMLFPTLNCLQRGQVGLLVTYLTLLGLRLSLGGGSWRGWAAGGAVLALAVTVKLTPIMPALFLLGMLVLPVVMGWNRRKFAPAMSLFGGMAAGLVLFLLLLPAVAVGWTANVQHLHRWVDLVVLNNDVGGENDLTYRSIRNQSLNNSVYRLGNWIAFVCHRGPDDLADPDVQGPMPMDQPIVARVLMAVRLGLLALLAAVGWRAARRGGASDLAAAYGAACVATLVISPLSWGHHYLIAAPGFLAAPLWYWQQGRVRFAKSLAFSACGLLWAHYLLLDWTARAGLLGIGTTVWFLVAAIGMLQRVASEEGAVADDRGGTKRAERGASAEHDLANSAERFVA
jgi:hypothetical protein